MCIDSVCQPPCTSPALETMSTVLETTSTVQTPCISDEDDVCLISGGIVQLLFWPVTTIDGNVCNKTGTTVTNTNTEPRSAIINGTTIVSPDVAIAINTLAAYRNDQCGGAVGTAYTDLILTMPPNSVFSGMKAPHIVVSSWSINYADLNPGQIPYRSVAERSSSITLSH